MPGRILRRMPPRAPVVLLLATVAACDPGSADPPRSTVAVTSTTYVTIPARSTTTTAAPAPADTSDSGGETERGDAEPATTLDDPNRERIHEIESGDYLARIARDYDVPINDIPAYNGWDDGLSHALVPGETVRIPPAGWTPDGEGGNDTTAASVGSEPQSSSAGCGTYTIKAGDTPARVANANDVSVADLDAANAGTPFYNGFVVGIDIVIPC